MAVTLACVAAVPLSADPQGGGSDLVDAERSFARRLAEEGMRAAFLSVMADDAVLFRPRPANGRQWFAEHPSPPGVLAWEPKTIEVSRSSDLGFTTGPWRYEAEGRPPAFGHYLSVWRHEEAGGWRLVLDIGVTHAASGEAVWQSEPVIRAASSEPIRAKTGLIEREREFATIVAEQGLREAYDRFGASDLRLFRNGGSPLRFASAPSDYPAPAAKLALATSAGSGVSVAGDLGYTYGLAQPDDALPGYSFARVWRVDTDGQWRLVVEVLLPTDGE